MAFDILRDQLEPITRSHPQWLWSNPKYFGVDPIRFDRRVVFM
jgi:hypothetical protein